MPAEHDPNRARRETMLTVMLCSLAVAGFLVFAVVFMGVFVLNALVVVAIVVGLGVIHYLCWGRSLSNEVGPEKEAEPPPEEDQWWTNGSSPHRRF